MYYWSDRREKDEKCGAFVTYGREEKFMQDFIREI
jgi:hypothetical protein